MGARSFGLFWEIIFEGEFLDQLYPGDNTCTLPSAYKHDQKEKPMQKYRHRLKIQPKIPIFAKKSIFPMTFSEEASTTTIIIIIISLKSFIIPCWHGSDSSSQ